MAVILALLLGILDYSQSDFSLTNYGLANPSAWLGLLAFAGLIYLLVKVPMNVAKSNT